MASETRPRTVLMILESCYPTEGGGGAEGQVRTISRYLRDCGVHVRIITPLTREAPQVEHERVDGIPVWRIPYPRIRLVGGFFMLGRLVAHLIRRRNEYDVIHAHIAHNMAAVASATGRLLGKTVIVKLTGWLELRHGILSRDVNPWLAPVMAAKRGALRSASCIQATSSQIRARLIERGFDAAQVKVIPNAVDLRRFDGVDAAPAEDAPLTAVYVGRLVPEKGVDLLLEAWCAAFEANDHVRLVLVGEGRLRERFWRWIDARGRAHQVELVGARSDIEHFLRQAHFGVLPSLYEGLSNTLLEYMAAGLPVLGTRVSGTEDFIEHGVCGWIAEPGDGAGLEDCLREIGRTARSRLAAMGAVARQRVGARAGIDSVVSQLAELYRLQDVLAAGSRGKLA